MALREEFNFDVIEMPAFPDIKQGLTETLRNTLESLPFFGKGRISNWLPRAEILG